MSRTTSNPSAESTTRTAPAAPAVQHICPFCGSSNSDLAKPCPRCTLEDTPATRSATQQRIGPWYVLQSRNPAAPGMNLATLQSLVRKGLVTPRSVIRGPTTHQLWRLAAKVKGVSRELGLCYGCGGAIDPKIDICPHCNRSQAVPTDPNALLELPSRSTQPAAATVAPVMREVPKPAVPPTPPAQARTVPPPAPDPVIAERPLRMPPSPDLLSAPDLAKAFQLDFKGLKPRRRRLSFAAKLLLIVVILAAAAGVTLYLMPSLGETILQRLHPAKSPAHSSAVVEQPTKALEVSTVDARLAADVATMERAQPPRPAMPMGLQTAVVAAGDAADNAASRDTSADDAKRLWQSAIDAESKRDFKTAVAAYERIKSLPSDAWPKSLQTRLQLARQESRGGVY
jgi:hypothetical protein